jgi:hypothetical protein
MCGDGARYRQDPICTKFRICLKFMDGMKSATRAELRCESCEEPGITAHEASEEWHHVRHLFRAKDNARRTTREGQRAKDNAQKQSVCRIVRACELKSSVGKKPRTYYGGVFRYPRTSV